jgi:hypothetical protein
MGKNTPQEDLQAAGAQESKLSLDEFCRRISETVKRPELIGGFEFLQRRAGHLKDTEAAFRARFDAFVKTPI